LAVSRPDPLRRTSLLLAVLLLIVLGVVLLVGRLFRKIEQGKALIISKVRKVDVTFTASRVATP